MTGVGHNGGPDLDDDRYPDQGGFVTIGRSIRQHPIVGFGIKGPHSPAEAWIDLIMECRYREGRIMNGGAMMKIMPGQMIGAVSWLADRWKWTPKQTRLFLDRLTEEGMITRGFGATENSDFGATPENNGNQEGKHRGKQAHFLTICNYEIYQYAQKQQGQIEGQSEGQTKGKSGANKGQQYKEEQRNKGIINNPLPPEGGARELRAAINRSAAKSAFDEWQNFARRLGLPVPRDTSFAVFGKKLATRLFEHADDPKGYDEMMAVLQLALANVERSAFLRGMSSGFRIDLKFLCQRESFAKLVSSDGYGNGAHAKAAGPQMDAIDAIVRGGR